MTKQSLPAVNEKAISLRDYLFSDNIKPVIESALPKWLSVDRLLRIVFTSSLKNPKILECSQQSIVQSVMQCAQLGLEPILGRAYLIPYMNTKKIGNNWLKVLECQMQVGYQGFVDLARRTDSVADVWGENVYESDEFELVFGMDRSLHHRPWYMDPKKREAGDPGDPIGAYVVWQFKDGTKHPHFMPIHEIHKRRAKSQAYQWAETGDPKKGGGKKDSVWHEWPEEQNLKTVIKHSSKLVPLSIEFMQAIEVDTGSEIGQGDAQRGFMLGTGIDDITTLPSADQPTAADNAEAFDRMIPEGTDPEWLQRFLEVNAVANNTTVEAVKAQAVAHHTEFYGAFSTWRDRRDAEPYPATNGEAPEGKSQGMDSWTAFRNDWINLRSGFADYVWKNKDRFAKAPEGIQQEARDKWSRGKDTKDHPFPLDKVNNEAAVAEPDEPKTMEKKSPIGKMVSCPDREGDNMAETFCNEQCSKRQGCPAWDNDEGFYGGSIGTAQRGR